MTIKRFLQRVTFYPAKFFVELMEYFTPPIMLNITQIY